MTDYALDYPKHHHQQKQNWYTTLTHALPALTGTLSVHDLDALPAFAVIVVSKRDNVGEYIQSSLSNWQAKNPNWQITFVQDNDTPKADSDTLTVYVHRYVLTPAYNLPMTKAKRAAAAHIIDEQITLALQDYHADVHILPISKVLTEYKLACFDMDSTLIEQEVIVELAKFCGVEDKISEITESAMRGEIDFSTSFARRVALLKGADITIIDTIIQNNLSFSPGAKILIKTLKALGFHTVLVSGGFTPFAKYVATTLGIDEYYANDLLAVEGKITGRVTDTILDGDRKAQIVQKVADKLGIHTDQMVCIGDGANDLPMMMAAGLGIAYHAKPIVQARADAAVNITGLEGVLYALGYATIYNT
ncbi:phosphoserine phosphatase SerB [Moraxella nasovis]|uniref:phosphoserine phosphatase SerB n=1 Tax=Moraxella nasovis TaxID=2904121 RepID=UPI001F60C910|nr:phosphoserine phosphatase SerB [Moraxella nasovis]UNU73707.1 phosphoserine phosphatase SerB [Moraxella nasovis]